MPRRGGAAVSAPAAAGREPLEVAVVGISTDVTCGVRDHATGLSLALADEGVSCTTHWLNRSATSLRGARAEVGEWTAALAAELERSRPDAVLLHYSVFSFAHRGLPLFTPPVLGAVRRAGVPLLTVLHEGAYNWGGRGPREAVWALTQRVALIELLRACAAVIVTSERRAEWFGSRRWLPSREIVVAPVFSNLPAPAAAARPQAATVGLFGYAHEGSEPALILDALGLVRERGVPARLLLLGAPGADSPAGERWSAAAAERGLSQALAFSGRLPAGELSAALGSCEVLLFADRPGPSSRKTTLAASLASGRPLLALDGPRSWSALVEADGALMVAQRAPEIAAALERLFADAGEREALAARGIGFYERAMSVQSSARTVAALLARVLDSAQAPRRARHSPRVAS